MRTKLLRDTEEPMVQKSSRESDDPSLAIP